MIHIRAFQSEEWHILKAKRLQALTEMPNVYFTKYADAAARPDEWWQFAVEDRNRQIFGLFDGEKLIGITAVFPSDHDPSGKTAMLGMSFIDAEYRGQRHSAKLYQARLDWARKAGFEKATVGHRKGNEASKAANQKFGFLFFEEEEIDFPDGRGIDCRYELRLKP